MKVLFVISCLGYGGAEKNMVLVANYLARKHDVVICNFFEHETHQILDKKIKCYNMEVISDEMTRGRFAWVGLRVRQYKFLNTVSITENPDIIVSFLPMPNALAVICGKKNKIPVIISERADPYQQLSKMDRVIHKIYEFADGAVFQTDGAKCYYGKKLQNKGTIIPNPVILNKNLIVHNYHDVKKEIVSVGRFENKQKRQDILLYAAQIVFKYYPEYSIVFWGDGPDEDLIRKLAKQLNIENKVKFAGVTDNTLEKMNQSEIFVLSSDYEGIPNVLIEAMSIGMPCVSTDCSPGGARMLLRDGEDGKLVPCGNYKELANAMIEFIADKESEEKFGLKAMKIVNRFSYEKIMEKWENYLLSFKHFDLDGGKNIET